MLTKTTQDADELRFNAQRLRNVAKLAGLPDDAIPQDDATLDGARGAILGQIAHALRNAATYQLPDGRCKRWCGDGECKEECQTPAKPAATETPEPTPPGAA